MCAFIIFTLFVGMIIAVVEGVVAQPLWLLTLIPMLLFLLLPKIAQHYHADSEMVSSLQTFVKWTVYIALGVLLFLLVVKGLSIPCEETGSYACPNIPQR